MSYNELFGLGSHSEDASLEGWWPLQDNAASTAVDDVSSNGNDGTLVGGDNTADITTTGPNNWLTAALNLDGAADYIDCPAPVTSYGMTLAAHVNPTIAVNQVALSMEDASAGNVYWSIQIRGGGSYYAIRRNTTEVSTDTTATGDDATWQHACVVFSNDTSVAFYKNGSASLTSTSETSVSASVDVDNFIIGRLRTTSPVQYFDGAVAGASVFSRPLSASEVAELEAGPEPINTVAPALSGTELVGETLTATSGTWALDAPFSGGSNGTVTYSYQWTRSDDNAGTGEADISGATSSTYVLTASDAGKYVRCRVRGTNDGGFDADADTNTAMSGKIATTTLLANLDAHYRLDETSGTVVRNDVRTLLLDDDFDSGSTNGTYGDVPTGWSEYNVSGVITARSITLSDGVFTIDLDGNGADTGYHGIRRTGLLTVGKRHIVVVRARVTVGSGTPASLRAWDGAWVDFLTQGDSTSGFETLVADLGTASNADLLIAGYIYNSTQSFVSEIDSVTVYEENAGTYVNSPTLGVPGKVGTAVTYNGTNQYANCPVAPSAYPFTVSAWCKPDDFDASMHAVTINDLSEANVYLGFRCSPTSGGFTVVRRNTTTVATNTGVSFDVAQWNHIVVVFEDATTVHAYKNGELVFSDDSLTSVALAAGVDGLLIGILRTASPGEYWNGSLDDVRLYSRALSPTEVYAVYSAALSQPNEFDSMAIGLSIGL